MAKKQIQPDAGITSVQKLITLAMLALMGYLFFMQDKHGATPPQLPASVAEAIQTPITTPVKVRITDTDSGDVRFSDLRKGKVLIGKWEVELEAEKPAETSKLKPKS